jgi:uncharacterized circularly permuted ATP-grasp superfamily protein
MTLLAKSQPPGPLLADYRLNGFFDEMFGREGGVLRHYEKLWSAFSRLTPEEFATKRHAVDLAFLRQGVTFNVYGDSRGAERVFPFDLMPRIIPAKEWELIERGLIQRITALNLFLHDIYHHQSILKDVWQHRPPAPPMRGWKCSCPASAGRRWIPPIIACRMKPT